MALYALAGALAWAAGHLPLVLGYLLLLAVPAAYLLWRSAATRAAARKADVRVLRAATSDGAKSSVLATAASPILEYLEIDDVVAAELCPDLRVTSLGRYMASLRPTGSVSLQGIIISAMERYGLTVALPLALFAPASWRRDKGVGGALAGTPYMALLAGNILSTLTLISASALARWQYAETRQWKEKAGAAGPEGGKKDEATGGAKKNWNALELMAAGGAVAKSDAALSAALTSPCALPADLAAAAGMDLASYDPAAPGALTPEPSSVHLFFPDLCSGNGGARMLCSPQQARVNEAMAVVANRLAGNALVGMGASAHEPTERFVVTLPAADSNVAVNGNDEFDSLEGLVAALEARGHTVEISIESNVTSFGAGLCVREKSGDGVEWTQIPLAYPLATGLYAQDEGGKPVEVVTLMQHAALYLRVSGPLLTCQLEWCLNIKGVTGWTPLNGINRPWACDPRAVVRHAENALSTAAGRHRALRLATAAATVVNFAAAEAGLMMGGYGALGVCIDSVAAIEAVLIDGGCTLYPLTLGGDAKMGLLMAYDVIEGLGAARDGGKWTYGAEATALRAAVAALPCDGLVEPTAAAATARRAMACLPERSIFAGAARCRAALEAAAAVADHVCGKGSVSA